MPTDPRNIVLTCFAYICTIHLLFKLIPQLWPTMKMCFPQPYSVYVLHMASHPIHITQIFNGCKGYTNLYHLYTLEGITVLKLN